MTLDMRSVEIGMCAGIFLEIRKGIAEHEEIEMVIQHHLRAIGATPMDEKESKDLYDYAVFRGRTTGMTVQ